MAEAMRDEEEEVAVDGNDEIAQPPGKPERNDAIRNGFKGGWAGKDQEPLRNDACQAHYG